MSYGFWHFWNISRKNVGVPRTWSALSESAQYVRKLIGHILHRAGHNIVTNFVLRIEATDNVSVWNDGIVGCKVGRGRLCKVLRLLNSWVIKWCGLHLCVHRRLWINTKLGCSAFAALGLVVRVLEAIISKVDARSRWRTGVRHQRGLIVAAG